MRNSDGCEASEPLRQAGIVTAAFHSNLYISDLLGWNRGWDVFYDSMEEGLDRRIPYLRGNVLNGKIARWLSSYTRGTYNRLFLWLHYMDIHEPYVPERKYVDMVDPTVTLSQDDMYGLFKEVLLKRDVSDPEKVNILKRLYEP